MWTVQYSHRVARTSRSAAARKAFWRKEYEIPPIRIWYFHYEIFAGDISKRILGVNFYAMHCSRKNGGWHEMVERDERRFSGCRLQIPRSSRRNLHLEGLWQPTLARATTFVPLSRLFHRHSLILSFFSALRIIVFFFHRFFERTFLVLFFPPRSIYPEIF